LSLQLNVRIATPKGEEAAGSDGQQQAAATAAMYALGAGGGALAAYGAAPALRPYGYVAPPPAATNALLSTAAPTNILKLGNMVSLAELADDTEYGEIKEDVEEELKRHGDLVALFIPRKGPFASFIFAEFSSVQHAAAAAAVLAAKSFGGRPLAVTYETPQSLSAARASAL
jgi:hypothetical protein